MSREKLEKGSCGTSKMWKGMTSMCFVDDGRGDGDDLPPWARF